MKNLIRGIAVLLTAVFLCFNIYYELAPGMTVSASRNLCLEPFLRYFCVLLFCGVPDKRVRYGGGCTCCAVSVLHMGAAECAVFR